MRPWIVIPVHNRREITLSCLEHLERNGASRDHEILVVDDGSTDGTSSAIQSRFPSVKILAGTGDLWWTGAIALGMKSAMENGATAICWLNDDCIPEADTLKQLAKYSALHPLALVAPLSVDASTGRPVAAGAYIGRTPVTEPSEAELEVDGVSGFCVWIPREVVERVGLPDAASFPHYYGDTSYMLAARRAGCRVVLLRAARAQLVAYRQRPMNVRHYLQCLPADTNTWKETFQAKRSPFRVATLFMYLKSRYGRVVGTILALARASAWQLTWARSRLLETRKNRGGEIVKPD